MKTMKKVLKWIGISLVAVAVIVFTLYLIYVRPFLKHMEETQVISYDKELTIIEGGGGNSGILVSDSLVIVIDTKMGDAAEALYERVHTLAGSKPVLVINTHDHSDHCGGNELFKGASILAGGNYTKEEWIKDAGEKNMPTEWLKDREDIKMGNETVTIINRNDDAHTNSDVFVYLHNRKMLFAGDVILNKQIPALVSAHASPDGYLEAFDELTKEFDIQKVVPGHGPMGGTEIIDNFRQYFVDMETASKDDSQKDALVEKYKEWNQIPFLMSPGATISAIKKQAEKK